MILRDFGAKNVKVFGSVRRNEATPTSDVDLLIEDLPAKSLLDIAHVKNRLRIVLNRRVDLVELSDLPWAMRPQVEAEAVPL